MICQKTIIIEVLSIHEREAVVATNRPNINPAQRTYWVARKILGFACHKPLESAVSDSSDFSRVEPIPKGPNSPFRHIEEL